MLHLAFSLFLVWFIYGALWEVFDMIYTAFTGTEDIISNKNDGVQ